jgi:hypothetical protein
MRNELLFGQDPPTINQGKKKVRRKGKKNKARPKERIRCGARKEKGAAQGKRKARRKERIKHGARKEKGTAQGKRKVARRKERKNWCQSPNVLRNRNVQSVRLAAALQGIDEVGRCAQTGFMRVG